MFIKGERQIANELKIHVLQKKGWLKAMLVQKQVRKKLCFNVQAEIISDHKKIK